ncbi:hypothetical protein AGABI1DRAFT_130281 [Agaricus bisporus var. burnettii JB137-S8]|uniref:Glutamine amidotransferase domain-containing protein n=1 Tax=Agaricus bisporus var. burnettii (strain JB137-S8 / ATCC MYA-4627 / FGSC 10392) TaxID=597362 RepID=K5XRU6_AGABU|nr:uncharacterized protein AGABI1DRAFT_130281 [Agaricus bisporus var. burnettii JB137-S8]EKM77590.1 hypothetical protein AGABI1DRAFT_130281 [Agaricus bisporus var. burnettii JB137-S8]
MTLFIPPLRTIRVALLVCGEFSKRITAEHGDYHSMFRRWLKNSLPPRSGITLSLEPYNVFQEKYPRHDQLPKYDAVMITGSPADAGSNVPWITRLVDFVRHVVDYHPQTRVYGICLGHQIVSRALGGRVERNEIGWEIGPGIVHTTDVGSLIFGVNKLGMQQIHRDHAPLAPLSDSVTSGDIHVLGSSCKTENQGLVKFYPLPHDLDVTRSNIMEHVHILTVQGHPEFTPSIVTSLTNEILGEGLISSTMARDVHKQNRLVGRVPFGGTSKMPDGAKIVGDVFWQTLGVRHDRQAGRV